MPIMEVNGNRFNYELKIVSPSSPLLVFHHGGGHSLHSFTLLVDKLNYNTLTFDCRQHGQTETTNDADLSLETLTDDLVSLIQKLEYKELVLIGHSMGAPVVISAVPRLKKVVGVIVLDVVEGTAIESLGMMMSILMRRPKSFKSEQDAIEWSFKNGGKNLESLKISVPGQLRKVNEKYYWRTDLESSKVYWQGWFENMSEKFLACKCAKLLVLAGADRLDKPLMIGQMQGKFQLIIIPESGHLIQEDVPEKLAVIIDEFYKRNQPLDISKIRKPLH